MKKIRERTHVKKIMAFLIGLIILWFFYLVVFAIIDGAGPISDMQGGIAGILSLITMIIYEILAEYNYLKRLELITASLYSNISNYKERESKLLSKAEQFILEFLQHESDMHKSVASIRSGNGVKTICDEETISFKDLKLTVENYPDLKSDKHISKILNQLEDSENAILNSKLLYNEYVTYYNTAIVSFPVSLLSGLWKLKMLQFYVDKDSDLE